jgi:hypothetical protein
LGSAVVKDVPDGVVLDPVLLEGTPTPESYGELVSTFAIPNTTAVASVGEVVYVNVTTSCPELMPARAVYSVSVYASIGIVSVNSLFAQVSRPKESETTGEVGVPPSLVTRATRRSLVLTVVSETVKFRPLVHSPLPAPSIAKGLGPGEGSELAEPRRFGAVAWGAIGELEMGPEPMEATEGAAGVPATRRPEET